MRPRRISELVELMQPAAVEVFGDDAVVGPDVVIDNRSATPGSLFVAVPGQRVDGHDFAASAVEAGAAGVLGTRATRADVPHLLAEDPVLGLSWLARGIVREARARGLVSIGVTGSSGKTSTKDLLAQLLEEAGDTVASEGNQNNEVGVPLTACRVNDSTEFLISEMGARGVGHISWLTSLVGLDVGVVLNVGTAHVGEFGGIERTAQAKGELVADLAPDGWAVLNGDDAHVTAMRHRTEAKVAWFGEGELPAGDMQVRATGISTNVMGQPSFTLEVTRDGRTDSAQVSLSVVGRHQVSNALAASAAALAVGLDLESIASVLSQAEPRSSWRMELRTRPDGVLVLNDSYNANPDSVAAALRTAVELGQYQRAENPGARVIAVLGDMLELGPLAEELHVAIGRLAGDLRVDELVAVGEYAQYLVSAAEEEGLRARVLAREEVAGSLALSPGDVVLVKGSRGIGLEKVAEELVSGGAAR
ncbi:UDP-N-acetylmuramoyl-tripeptide--D-alanyl-D-alanine ligase [Tessaracoccus rhinocerotis]|uniref:UDP-N-acetylmuramoyl-tripeptide--D-alanyl-D-alanine ligase n=1 Tax=Tessaracoccus rhinocerotis TaxID=1689449 RepID=A0A553K2H4_9ACTN|nr:UDP-N-acetylmuramoyl-tripeptide--D-alanyl-D-alanine ligase [Tessaracoccus rhinocerotis]TRY18888.1 UDP-N-acetylmuramoyl-tripeptide--D-alanyl-D-alanine ligase [Tessaracoccus rhinocerotis]